MSEALGTTVTAPPAQDRQARLAEIKAEQDAMMAENPAAIAVPLLSEAARELKGFMLRGKYSEAMAAKEKYDDIYATHSDIFEGMRTLVETRGKYMNPEHAASIVGILPEGIDESLGRAGKSLSMIEDSNSPAKTAGIYNIPLADAADIQAVQAGKYEKGSVEFHRANSKRTMAERARRDAGAYAAGNELYEAHIGSFRNAVATEPLGETDSQLDPIRMQQADDMLFATMDSGVGMATGAKAYSALFDSIYFGMPKNTDATHAQTQSDALLQTKASYNMLLRQEQLHPGSMDAASFVMGLRSTERARDAFNPVKLAVAAPQIAKAREESLRAGLSPEMGDDLGRLVAMRSGLLPRDAAWMARTEAAGLKAYNEAVTKGSDMEAADVARVDPNAVLDVAAKNIADPSLAIDVADLSKNLTESRSVFNAHAASVLPPGAGEIRADGGVTEAYGKRVTGTAAFVAIINGSVDVNDAKQLREYAEQALASGIADGAEEVMLRSFVETGAEIDYDKKIADAVDAAGAKTPGGATIVQSAVLGRVAWQEREDKPELLLNMQRMHDLSRSGVRSKADVAEVLEKKLPSGLTVGQVVNSSPMLKQWYDTVVSDTPDVAPLGVGAAVRRAGHSTGNFLLTLAHYGVTGPLPKDMEVEAMRRPSSSDAVLRTPDAFLDDVYYEVKQSPAIGVTAAGLVPNTQADAGVVTPQKVTYGGQDYDISTPEGKAAGLAALRARMAEKFPGAERDYAALAGLYNDFKTKDDEVRGLISSDKRIATAFHKHTGAGSSSAEKKKGEVAPEVGIGFYEVIMGDGRKSDLLKLRLGHQYKLAEEAAKDERELRRDRQKWEAEAKRDAARNQTMLQQQQLRNEGGVQREQAKQ